jgi:hypothetical protein
MPETVESNVVYEIDQDGLSISQDLAVHREIGDSEFDYVLVGSNPDDGSELVAFGFHRVELDFPTPEEETDA